MLSKYFRFERLHKIIGSVRETRRFSYSGEKKANGSGSWTRNIDVLPGLKAEDSYS